MESLLKDYSFNCALLLGQSTDGSIRVEKMSYFPNGDSFQGGHSVSGMAKWTTFFDLQEAFAQILWISRLLGTCPYDANLKLSVPRLAYSLLTCSLSVWFSILHMFPSHSLSSNYILHLFNRLQFSTMGLYAVVSLVTACLDLRKYKMIFAQLREVDATLGHRVACSNAGVVLRSASSIVALAFSFALYLSHTFQIGMVFLSRSSQYFYTSLLVASSICQIDAVLSYCRARFEAINSRATADSDRLVTLAKAHFQLRTACLLINRAYFAQLLAVLFTCFIVTLSMFYFLFLQCAWLFNDQQRVITDTVASTVAWVSIGIFQIHVLVSSCTRTTKKVN